MLDDMDEHVFLTHVGIGGLHAIAVFLDQPIVSFDCRSQGLELLVDG